MGRGQKRKETEIKLPIGRPGPVRRRLQRLGFQIIEARSFEHNEIFDSRNRRLGKRGYLLRLRSINGRHFLTFKGPSEFSRHFKIRREAETALTNPKAIRAAFAALGLRAAFRYQKFRTVYAGRGRWGGGEVMLDETPVGNFLELEGSREWIRRLARRLGARPDAFVTKSYAALYSDWCRRRRQPFGDMVFRRRGLGLTKEKRKRI